MAKFVIVFDRLDGFSVEAIELCAAIAFSKMMNKIYLKIHIFWRNEQIAVEKIKTNLNWASLQHNASVNCKLIWINTFVFICMATVILINSYIYLSLAFDVELIWTSGGFHCCQYLQFDSTFVASKLSNKICNLN